MKSTYDLEFYHHDRRVSLFREGAERFEFTKSTQRAIRREKRIAARGARHQAKQELRNVWLEKEAA